MEVSPGRFWKGDTKWINNCFVLDFSVRFSINRPVRSHSIEEEFKYKPFIQDIHRSLHGFLYGVGCGRGLA